VGILWVQGLDSCTIHATSATPEPMKPVDPGFMHTFFLGKEGMHTHQVRFKRNYRR
jgi:hypothetical protein